jgi:hypothetical protein
MAAQLSKRERERDIIRVLFWFDSIAEGFGETVLLEGQKDRARLRKKEKKRGVTSF